MNIHFTKCHANGNDFIFLCEKNFPKKILTGNIIRKLCSRYTGIGADGLFLITKSKKYDFILDYYNADGSWETLCANGSRCAVQLMYSWGEINNETIFLAGDGAHAAKILSDGSVSMQMKSPVYRSKLLSPAECDGYFIDSGARHFVCASDNLMDEYIYKTGQKIRYSNLFQPFGINVNFFKLRDNHAVDIRTYEKGIEQVMLSCASGSIAVVFHLSRQNFVLSPVKTFSRGGSLIIRFDADWKAPWLDGPAVILFSGEFLL